MRLEVQLPSKAMLQILWATQLSKGVLSLDAAAATVEGTPVQIALVVQGEAIELPATVERCTRRRGSPGFFVDVRFERFTDEQTRQLAP